MEPNEVKLPDVRTYNLTRKQQLIESKKNLIERLNNLNSEIEKTTTNINGIEGAIIYCDELETEFRKRGILKAEEPTPKFVD